MNLAWQMSAFLVTAWEALAKQHEADSIWDLPVEFNDVKMLMPVPFEKGQKVTLEVRIDFKNHFQASQSHIQHVSPTLKWC